MEPSVELRNAVLRWYESESSGDVKAFEHLFSHQPGILFIGTDPEEWWSDFDVIQRVFTAQLQELGPKIKIIPGDLHAFVEGTVGWAADSAKLRLPNGQEIPIRSTMVFHREAGEWKVVQHHASIGARNEDALGTNLTVK